MEWLREIEELHAFFERWLGGEAPNQAVVFQRLEDALAAEFTLVTPSGALVNRPALIRSLRQAHGRRKGLSIEVRNPVLIAGSGPLLVARYEEWQQIGSEWTARLSTVVFRAAPAAANGVRWLHLHETRISTE